MGGKTAGSGQPERYKPEYVKQAYKIALLGSTDAEMADIFEVSRQTLNNWKKKYPEFKESIDKGKVLADAEVAFSLYKRAIGYKHKETKAFCSDGIIITKEVTRRYAPCPVAGKLWLNNRQPDKWRDKRDEEEKETELDLSKLTTDEVKEYLAIITKAKR